MTDDTNSTSDYEYTLACCNDQATLWCEQPQAIQLYEHRDQVFGWVYSKLFNEWSIVFKYWKAMVSEYIKGQVSSIRTSIYYSGFIHKWRGLHWNRLLDGRQG